MADLATVLPAGRVPSAAPAAAGGAVAAALCAIAIFHFNELLLYYALTPIPTEIAAEYQVVFAYIGAVLAHRLAA